MLHFEYPEFERRVESVLQAADELGLEGLLLFKQESLYYLTGFDTFGFVFFQAMYLHKDGRMSLLTRAPDLRQAQETSTIKDIRVWVDGPNADPASELRQILAEYDCKGKKIGIEMEAYGLTMARGLEVQSSMAGFVDLIDVSNLVSVFRAVKSQAELKYVRRAAELADHALIKARPLVKAGAFEGDILATLQGEIFRADGDYPANDFIMGSGENALLFRSFAGHRKLTERDQLSIEFAGVYRHYHAGLVTTLLVGEPSKQHLHMHQICVDSLKACEQALRPGEPVGKAFDAYASICDAAGMRENRFNACGYSLGAAFSPTWMDWPMLYQDNPVIAEPGMVFFPQAILVDSKSQHVMSVGHTVIVTGDGCEPLSHLPMELYVVQ